MISAFLVLIACELLGEIVRRALGFPAPGPVVGMFILAGILALRRDNFDAPAIPEALRQTSESLISNMGLLFVPAGVGIVAEAGLLRKEWLPLTAGLIGSTIASLAVTALVMHWTTRPAPGKQPRSEGSSDNSTIPLESA
jgi:holin-like protein